MKKITVTLLMSAVALASAASSHAAQLTDKDKQFLTNYEKAHIALSVDDLSGAKEAASELGSDGADLAKSNSLKAARVAFEKLSAKAKELSADQSGYHVYHCPMLNKDWIQTSTKVANPYGGKGMAGCGELQK